MFCEWFIEMFKGYKQEEIARETGEYKSLIQKWLRGIEPTWNSAKKVTKKLGYKMTVDGYSDFGEWLRVRRQENELSICALSLDTGICAERIHNYEHGGNGRLATMAILIDYFGATFSITKEIN